MTVFSSISAQKNQAKAARAIMAQQLAAWRADQEYAFERIFPNLAEVRWNGDTPTLVMNRKTNIPPVTRH